MGKDNPISNIQCPKVLPQPQLNKLHPRSRSQSRRLFIRFILSQDSSDLRLKPLPESQNCLRISERRLESTDKPIYIKSSSTQLHPIRTYRGWRTKTSSHSLLPLMPISP